MGVHGDPSGPMDYLPQQVSAERLKLNLGFVDLKTSILLP